MIRGVNILNGVPVDLTVLYIECAAIKNPVDLVAVCFSCESMMSAWKGLLKDALKIRRYVSCLLAVPGEYFVAGTQGSGIKVAD